MPNYRGNEKQDLMIPVCLDDQLVPGTIEHAINWIVDYEIDTSVFDAAYHNDHGGRSAYDPAALVKIILCAYSNGILSSRKIEEACRTNVVFMALSGDIRPDHATIARFVTGHPAAIRHVFRDVLMIAAQGDLIGGEVFALDGCRISSNAAREHAGTQRELKKKMAKLEARLEAMLCTHRDTDEQHDPDDDEPDGPGSGGVHRYRARIDRITGFLDTHPPRIGTSGREVKANITDTESATLKSGSGSLQGYNALAMVDAKHQIVLHAEPVGQIHEAPLLPRMVRRSLHTLRRFAHPQARTPTILADTSYFTEANARFLIDSQLDGYIPDHQFRNRDIRFAEPGCMGEQQSERIATSRSRARRAAHRRFTHVDFLYQSDCDTYRCPAGNELRRRTREVVAGRRGTRYEAQRSDCSACALAARCLIRTATRRRLFRGDGPVGTYAQQMRERIDTERGRRMYARRMGIVEPVFANITATKGMRRFTLRGRAKVRIQWLLYTLVHNIEKIATTGLIHRLIEA